MDVNTIIDTYLGTIGGGACVPVSGVPSITGIFCVLVKIVNYLLTTGGFIAFIFLVVGGLQYMVSGGDEKAITTAKSTITYSVFGLLIILASVIVINTILSTLLK
jgi:hypothetical protein